MKRCPSCNAEYYDNLLEFCLEDGSRLLLLAPEAATKAAEPARTTNAETAAFRTAGGPPAPQPAREVETIVARAEPAPILRTSNAALVETAPIVLALAHNWWQWLYLEKQYVSSIAEYLLSANFLMWLLLLVAGVIVGLFSLKQSERKAVAYISLIILAINLLLYLVPRR